MTPNYSTFSPTFNKDLEDVRNLISSAIKDHKIELPKESNGWPIAVDPAGCGCTECLTGEYIPLDAASSEDISALLWGYMGNNTGVDIYLWLKQDGLRVADRFRTDFLKEES